jgi:hypothetical protein
MTARMYRVPWRAIKKYNLKNKINHILKDILLLAVRNVLFLAFNPAHQNSSPEIVTPIGAHYITTLQRLNIDKFCTKVAGNFLH